MLRKRGAMVGDVHIRKGMKRDEVLKLIGQPDRDSRTDAELSVEKDRALLRSGANPLSFLAGSLARLDEDIWVYASTEGDSGKAITFKRDRVTEIGAYPFPGSIVVRRRPTEPWTAMPTAGAHEPRVPRAITRASVLIMGTRDDSTEPLHGLLTSWRA